MYLLQWNSDEGKLEASLGGVITKGEAEVLLEDIKEALTQIDGDFDFILDTSVVKRFELGATDELDRARKYARLHGAKRLTVVARDDREAESLTTQNLQSVLEGWCAFVTVDSLAA